MQSLSVDPSWGVELIESAIEMFTLNRPGIISDSTLEAVLSVTYYPTLLKLLVKENLTVVWFCLYIRYRQDHLFLERSFGFLLLQILGLSAMVAVLERNNQLTPFVESLSALRKREEVDVSPMLKIWLMRYANEAIVEFHIALLGLEHKLGWVEDEDQKKTCLENIGGFSSVATFSLLKDTYTARGDLLKAHACIPDLGYPILLVIMWGHLRFASHDDKLQYLGGFRDCIIRYLLVSSPTEHLVMATIVEEIARHGKVRYAPAVDSTDTRTLADVLLRQLSIRRSNGTPIGLRYIAILVEFILQDIEASKLFQLYEPIFTAAFDRLWHEIDLTCQDHNGEYWEHVLVYANLLFSALQSSTLSQRPNSRTGATAFLDLMPFLLQIDLPNIAAHLILLPSAAITGNDPETGEQFRKEAFEGTLEALSFILYDISKYKELACPTFKLHNLDWLKTYNYILQLKSMTLPPTHPLRPYLSRCQSTWHRLGEVLGCLDALAIIPCAYSRCAGVEMSVTGRYVCEGCLASAYCSVMCQNADWSNKDSAARLLCSQSDSFLSG